MHSRDGTLSVVSERTQSIVKTAPLFLGLLANELETQGGFWVILYSLSNSLSPSQVIGVREVGVLEKLHLGVSWLTGFHGPSAF